MEYKALLLLPNELANIKVCGHNNFNSLKKYCRLYMKRGIIMHIQPPVSQVVRLASRLSSETPALGKDRQGMFVE